MAALFRLVEWHTPDAQLAIQAVRFDRDSHMVKAAEKALEVFPGTGRGLSSRSEQWSVVGGQWPVTRFTGH